MANGDWPRCNNRPVGLSDRTADLMKSIPIPGSALPKLWNGGFMTTVSKASSARHAVASAQTNSTLSEETFTRAISIAR
jgi:hypothetical protein